MLNYELDLNQFIKNNLSEKFIPFADYDKHLDCIRVQIRDCSFTEKRLSGIFTILEANHVDTNEYVGFTIKGVNHLFKTLGLSTSGVINLAEIIDKIVRVYPDGVVKLIQEQFVRLFQQETLEVNFAEAA